ncbi:uncharacterized protein LOC127081482 [Lathyrus oleraceus]|uniref:uncharacterized protein LOC127081482 n=1 Tax=Pisum sativum TaxID=3888 RepID=UPI0021D293C9|nr:uncharacterized protein LOC127081482 [Pisum sativum]
MSFPYVDARDELFVFAKQVNEFVNDEDINDFPLEYKVELPIDLVSGISHVLMAPYRMFSSELSELKKKLEELLEKKFVRPRVSSGGVSVLLDKKKYGSMRFEMFGDYKSLKYLFDYNELNMRHMRWLEFLKDYDFCLSYHPGKANVAVDALSRKS